MSIQGNLFKACKDCSERAVGCHDICEKYKDARAENERLKALKYKRNDIIDYIASTVEKNRESSLRHRLRKRRGFGPRIYKD